MVACAFRCNSLQRREGYHETFSGNCASGDLDACLHGRPGGCADLQYDTAGRWSYGSGNNYSPSNTTVLATDAGSALYLRLHQTFFPGAASDAGVYSFALGTPFVSFDWGVDNNTAGFAGVTALITLTNIGSGQSYVLDPFLAPDNASIGGSLQNSARINWFPVGFDPGVDDTYKVELDVTGLEGGAKSLAVYAKLGAGAVPEPASWAMMIVGLGAVGGALRTRRRTTLRFA